MNLKVINDKVFIRFFEVLLFKPNYYYISNVSLYIQIIIKILIPINHINVIFNIINSNT
jgi:hypothetical protein